MKLIRYEHPGFEELDRFLGFEPFGTLWNRFFEEPSTATPNTDLYEDDQNYYVRVELPGIKREQIELQLEKNVLTLSAHDDKKAEGQTRRFDFQRSLSVPDGVRHDGISASLENGVLTVTLPKDEGRKPLTIDIN